MRTITINSTNEKLENAFSKLNERFFDGKLQQPVILAQTEHMKKVNGWCTTKKVWKELSESSDDSCYEITIAAEHLDRPFEEICETLLHEMVHLWNIQNGVQDTSRGGYYHNKAYKLAAEAHGLKVAFSTSYGWNDTSLSEEALEFVRTFPDMQFDLYRLSRHYLAKAYGSCDPESDADEISGKIKKQIHYKYQCPICRANCRATKKIQITCGKCGQPFALV